MVYLKVFHIKKTLFYFKSFSMFLINGGNYYDGKS
nr:MAG TPA: hypothetical protein [Caudoviricetes sp.]